ncbi:type II toxin-antitoxin system HicA family toxin [uncultured Mailhella sp.]|uniref:type II toxin-antitoxin system HicA family toxin n=1 Tax=uncultured Mailhella sp. TaxID=1981031 RepID=UPI002630983A|nr:type II toxin-antitoxin system HicA family toxin [uncultured Mailhella sp.]
MNSRHEKTLQAIYALPTSRTLEWKDMEALFIAPGATVIEGDGSRVKFMLQGRIISFHRPHRPKTVRAYQVELAREFLQGLGIVP